MVEEPHQQYAMKSQHDFADKVELPEFINIPMDQGTESKPEGLVELVTDDIPTESLASISSTKLERGKASIKRKPVQVKGKKVKTAIYMVFIKSFVQAMPEELVAAPEVLESEAFEPELEDLEKPLEKQVSNPKHSLTSHHVSFIFSSAGTCPQEKTTYSDKSDSH